MRWRRHKWKAKAKASHCVFRIVHNSKLVGYFSLYLFCFSFFSFIISPRARVKCIHFTVEAVLCAFHHQAGPKFAASKCENKVIIIQPSAFVHPFHSKHQRQIEANSHSSAQWLGTKNVSGAHELWHTHTNWMKWKVVLSLSVCSVRFRLNYTCVIWIFISDSLISLVRAAVI